MGSRMMVCGIIIRWMAMASSNGQMAAGMKGFSRMENSMERASITKRMAKLGKVSGAMAKDKKKKN